MNSIYHLKCCKKNKIVLYIYIYFVFLKRHFDESRGKDVTSDTVHLSVPHSRQSEYSKILYGHNEWALLFCCCELFVKWVGLPNSYITLIKQNGISPCCSD